MTRSLHLAWICAIACCAVFAASQAAQMLDLATFPQTQLQIRSGTKVHRFDVWVADRPDRQQQGLMFVRDLPESRGMLFIDETPREWSIWMKNTYIPLDILFIGTDGRIAWIVEQATPHSLKSMGPGFAVQGVLELRGGEVARRGLRTGDTVTWQPVGASGMRPGRS